MSNEADKPTGKPRGKSLGWTKADIANLSKVSAEDVTSANAAFRRWAPKPFKTLLNARRTKKP